ncbi:TIGR04222 domain-containing membrane protein [Streptomyces atroolivaceus]|uniref:TIGR04222 domain-containing membrane protein n=1 Tax=Streptomyces atroolivaceus TaxID=66869 RepID=UPI003639AE58
MNALALLLNLAVAVSTTLLVIATVNAGRGRSAHAVQVHDLAEAAFLNGGPARVVDTALTALHADGRLVVGGPGIVAVHQRAEARDAVERAVLQELRVAPSGSLHALRESVMRHPAVQEIGDGLAARGLLVPPGESAPRRRWAFTQAIVCIVGVPVSLVLTFVQYGLHAGHVDTPYPFVVKVLPALAVGGLVGMLAAASAGRRITQAGRSALNGFRATYAYVTDPALLVATRGLRALPDPGLQAQLVAAARQRPVVRRSPASASSAFAVPVVWCAGVSPGGGSCGSSSGGGGGTGPGSACGSGSGCGGSGSGCGSGSGSGCGGGSSSGSSCGGGSSSGGSSCGSSS